jgi:hypothetical protein
MDESPQEQLEQCIQMENERLKTENEALRQQTIVRTAIALTGYMRMLTKILTENPNLSRKEAYEMIKQDWTLFHQEQYPETLTPENEARGDQYLSLFFELCWQYAQLYHPETKDVLYYAIYREDSFIFVPIVDMTSKEFATFVEF